MKNLLIVLTVFVFAVTLYYGKSLYERYVPPFRKNTCLIVDYAKLSTGKLEEGQKSLIIGAKVNHNFISRGYSQMFLIFVLAPGSYFISVEDVPFYNLRLAKPMEVSCDQL
jgi:hypothetical protein